MNTLLLTYFLKANLALAILYISYRMLFQKDTFFSLRRMVLLSIILTAFLYQLPDISSWLLTRTRVTEMLTYYSSIVPIEISAQATEQVDEIGWKENLLNISFGIYLTGVVLLFARCLIELFAIVRTYLTGRKIRIGQRRVCLLPEAEKPYSFFGWIFIPEDKYREDGGKIILAHELRHSEQWHSLDVLLSEMVCILFWINPFAWLLKNEIHINHEYIADDYVMQSGFDKKEYQYYLIGMKHPVMAIANLYNNFSVLPLKKRITMLNKKRTSSVGKVKYLALIPLFMGLMFINNIDVMARIESGKTPEPAPVISKTTLAVPLPPEDEKVYDETPIAPEYTGGYIALLRYIENTTVYPKESQDKKEQGKVVVEFIIDKEGNPTDFAVKESATPLLDAEALRVVKSIAKWKPGKLDNGKAVCVRMTMPIMFKLQ